MVEETEHAVRRRVRRLRRRERRLQRRDDDESDSEDESSSPAAPASTRSSSSEPSTLTTITTTSTSHSFVPTTIVSTPSTTATPTAIPITVGPSPTPFSTRPITSSDTSEPGTSSSLATSQLDGLNINAPSRLPSIPAVSERPQESSGTQTPIAIAAGVSSALLVILGVLACVLLRRRYKRRRQTADDQDLKPDDASDRALVRGTIQPAMSLLWRPWSRSAPPNPQRARTEFFVSSNDGGSYFAANAIRAEANAMQSSRRSRWYSFFSGSDWVAQAASASGQRVLTRNPSSFENEKTVSVQAIPQDIEETADRNPIKSRFSGTERTSTAPTSGTISIYLNSRDSIKRPETAYRTSSALEREYVSMPLPSGTQMSTALSTAGSSMVSERLQPPPFPKVPWKYSVGSLKSWLEDRNKSKQNLSRLP